MSFLDERQDDTGPAPTIGIGPARAIFRHARATLSDPELVNKFSAVPDVVDAWLVPYGGLQGRDVLDFGCGFGETAAGVALGYDVASVVGVDVQDKPLQCLRILNEQFGFTALPSILRLEQIDERTSLGDGAFDLVISWSVMEHVTREKLEQTVMRLKDALRPGGMAFIQISPLYFSPEGSHLWALGYRAWDHLLKQTSEVLDDIRNARSLSDEAKDRLICLYSSLNRLTADELKRLFERAGFEVLREQRDRTDASPQLMLTEAYNPDALTTFQIVLLLRKPAYAPPHRICGHA